MHGGEQQVRDVRRDQHALVEATLVLVAGLHDEVIVRDDSAKDYFPDIKPMDYRTAVARALSRLDAGTVETSWSDALFSSQADEPPVVLVTHDPSAMTPITDETLTLEAGRLVA